MDSELAAGSEDQGEQVCEFVWIRREMGGDCVKNVNYDANSCEVICLRISLL